MTSLHSMIRPVHPLHEHLVTDGPGGFGQELEFVQVLLDLPLPSFFKDDTDEYRFLCLV